MELNIFRLKTTESGVKNHFEQTLCNYEILTGNGNPNSKIIQEY